MKRIFSVVIFFTCAIIYGQSIFSNDITGTNPAASDPYTTGQVVDANITVSGIGRGTGLIAPPGNTADRYNARTWENVFDADDYFYFTITPNSGYQINFTSFFYTGQSSAQGPVSAAFRSSLDVYTANIGTSSIAGTTIDLSASSYQNITGSITFRFYAWGASNGNGTFSINDFIFNGTVTPICASTTTWDGASWNNGTPNINKAAVLNGNYSTASQASFSACSLTINSGTLTIANGDYVEVQRDLVANGNIIVNPEGAFVQINDDGTVSGTGTITVEKQTAPANNWYEYTYWSSPVVATTIADGLSDAQTGRVFKYAAQNFLDATKETNNNGATDPGQDDIDDDGNDWQAVSGAAVMQPGMGYASTHDEFIFNSSPGSLPRQFIYTFNGFFNNGDITVPLYRNDSELNDKNWNFIGNPYPSAIDVDAFFSANPDVDGAIYLWSQNTQPSSTANGNQVLNFSDSDYAIINSGVGGTAGGDGITPNKFIPSCQGFFVTYSDAATPIAVNGTIKEGSVTFTNSMRVKGATDNSQFFKTANTKKQPKETLDNKLWLNLTSNNGVFNQALIGYVDGATKHDDGAHYDATKVFASKSSAVLYSIIKGSDKKYAIQGKNTKDLSVNEKIQLGFSTTISVPTLYTLSIAKLQGQFLEENTIYLRDKILRKTHDLSASDYTFTSEVGEFKNRFEIVFKSLGNSSPSEERSVSISKAYNDATVFSTADKSDIKSVKIYDFYGSLLYSLKGNASSEIYILPNLKPNTIYIAKVELSNGLVYTKKIVRE
ncbi:T9SS type A sorting domain-containing protein [Aestuariivivens sp. NBU2969]|uniref:T9SS type A sorting domain-containing protein n=1 Tax=Aestuariivivens sp. NBU2969 TaxID=2873267 RepID=UPI001CBFF0DF|nr:T9SS type A sorting domain-containing protein [Aestuariivivens sp. NBU2969]